VGIAALIAWLLTGFGLAQPARAAVDVVCDKRFQVQDGADTLELVYCGNIDLSQVNYTVDRAIISLHGGSRNADDYFVYSRDAGTLAGGADATTAIIAPQFLIESDLKVHKLPSSILYWTSNGWKKGNTSQSSNKIPRPFTVSAFSVIDRIIERLADAQAFPLITDLVFAGHSAGGQFVNRYAAGGSLAGTRPGLFFRYVVTNPSSYLYFSPERAEDGTTDVFSVPDVQSCPSYNDYKYGLQDLNSYMTGVGAAEIGQRYRSRSVVTFLGWNDNDPNHSSLATSCPAMFQGEHRRERGEIHFNHVQKEFGAEILDRQRLDYVPGVGHSGRRMFQSNCGLFHLYDHDPDGTACTEQVVFADSFEFGLGTWTQGAQAAWLQSSARDDDGSYSAEIEGPVTDATLVSPEIILNGAASATAVASLYIESGLDTGEYLAFDLSTDGGQTWDEISRIDGNVDPESEWHQVNTTVSDAQSVMLRFRGTMSTDTEDAYVDNVYVTIDGTSEPPGGPINIAPKANFSFSTADLTASFTDLSSDSDGSVVSWSWDFGDGNTSSAQNPSHTYAAAGSYTVTLIVTDDGDATDTATRTVDVSDPPTPQAADSFSVDSLVASSTSQGRYWTANVTISLLDDGVPALPVSGATVQGEWNPGSIPGGCTTWPDGSCVVSLSQIRKRDGSVTFQVNDVVYDISECRTKADGTTCLDYDSSDDPPPVVVSKP
jgi:PKD repeat protein